jgi:hypothetical protein
MLVVLGNHGPTPDWEYVESSLQVQFQNRDLMYSYADSTVESTGGNEKSKLTYENRKPLDSPPINSR